MTENLNVDHYRNGDPIPEVCDPDQWAALQSSAWCYYGNDPANGVIYGKLYNWYAVNDPRGLSPEGWHVPSDEEWQKLEVYLGMKPWTAWNEGIHRIIEVHKLKESGTCLWEDPNEGVTNMNYFSALPGGYRHWDGHYGGIGDGNGFWSSSAVKRSAAWGRVLEHYRDGANIVRLYYNVVFGLSVRCVRD